MRTPRSGVDDPLSDSLVANPAAGEGALAFGSQLRRLRLRAGLARDGLAERAQVSVATLAALESGQRRRPHPHRLHRARGHMHEAWIHVREGLGLHQQMGCPAPAVRGLEIAAGLLAATDTAAAEFAVRMFAAAESKRCASGLPLPMAERSEYERDIEFVRNGLGHEAFARAWTECETIGLEQAVAELLAMTRSLAFTG